MHAIRNAFNMLGISHICGTRGRLITSRKPFLKPSFSSSCRFLNPPFVGKHTKCIQYAWYFTLLRNPRKTDDVFLCPYVHFHNFVIVVNIKIPIPSHTHTQPQMLIFLRKKDQVPRPQDSPGTNQTNGVAGTFSEITSRAP